MFTYQYHLNMTFQKLTKLSMEKLAKQPLLTYEQMKEQILRVKLVSKANRNRKEPVDTSK